jgi:hypothetical protein
MREKEKSRKGKYRGELRSRFNILEQWDGKKWREPPEVGVYGGAVTKINFSVENSLLDCGDAVDRAFRPR